jgi:hypothetical protein
MTLKFYNIDTRSIILKYRGVDVKKLGRVGLKLRPTFTEFVNYLVDDFKAGVSLDMHWTPVYSFCNPCQVGLDSCLLCDIQ